MVETTTIRPLRLNVAAPALDYPTRFSQGCLLVSPKIASDVDKGSVGELEQVVELICEGNDDGDDDDDDYG